MSTDIQNEMVNLSDEVGSGLDLNLSLHSTNPSSLSSDLHLGLNPLPFVSNGKEVTKPPTREFDDGGSQDNALSIFHRKKNRMEEHDQRRNDQCRSVNDEEEGENTRKKLRLSWDQTLVLEETFNRRPTLNATQKESLAKELGIQTRQVEVWFQNRRARIKVKQTEAEAEYMKQSCLSLMDRVRRLQKEVNELRAQKIYMQIPPATTLTLCPSCERVGNPTSSGRVSAGRVKIEEDLDRTGLGLGISWANANQMNQGPIKNSEI